MKSAHRSWLSPFVAVTYVAVAFTGILMLFHLKLPGVHSIHQWGGIIFVIGGTIHLLLNWRVLVSYFKQSKAVWGALGGLLALLFILLTAPASRHGDRYNGDVKGDRHYELQHRR